MMKLITKVSIDPIIRHVTDLKDAAVLMKPADEDILQRWQVSEGINSSRARNDDLTLIEPATVA